MPNDIQQPIMISRREVLTSVSMLTALAMTPTILTPAFSHAITQAATCPVGAVLWDMPYLDACAEAAYQPCAGLRGGEAAAGLDEALFRSHHVYT